MPKPRKQSTIRPSRILRIYCEGEKTEPNYLNGYISTLPKGNLTRVVSVEPTEINTPVQLVELACRTKRSGSFLDGDEFWVVYDRESTSKYSDALHAQAWQKAQADNIQIALSNVCFEYWLILHFYFTDAPYESYLDLLKRSRIREFLNSKSDSDYKKSNADLFNLLKDKVSDARRRGLQVNRRGLNAAVSSNPKPFQINPYVGVVDLLDAIDIFAKG